MKFEIVGSRDRAVERIHQLGRRLELPRGGKARVRGISAERSGMDAAGEERGQRRIVLGDPFQGYLDGAGHVDAGSFGTRSCSSIMATEPDRPRKLPS